MIKILFVPGTDTVEKLDMEFLVWVGLTEVVPDLIIGHDELCYDRLITERYGEFGMEYFYRGIRILTLKEFYILHRNQVKRG